MASDLKTRIVHFCQYLQDPQHVARFQQICGVRGTFSRNLCGRQAEQRHNGACMNHHYLGESENDSVNGGGDGERGDGPWLRKKTTTGNSLKLDVCKNGLRNGAVLTPGAGETVGCGPNSCCFGEAVVDGEAKETPFENCPNDACGVDYLREKNAGEVNETLSHRHTVKARRKNSLTGDIGQEFLIENKFLFYMFTLGTELGNELFYITFFPFLIWNIDPYVSRRLILIWVWVMYLGQCTKDVIRWSRPASPPVVKVEMFYNSEYSMPSTHAMSGTAIPFSLFLLTYGRWEYSFVSGLLLAFTWCGLVCVSRIYMGMHSILDVLVGFFYSILILVVFQPALDVIDNFHLTCRYAPLLITSLHLGLGIFSFTLDNWSTSRGDTAQILGTGAGIALASHLNHRLGLLPDLPAALLPIYPPPLSVALVARSLLRLLLGVPVLLASRALMKALTIPLVCRIFGIPSGDVRKARQHMQVELPYRYIVYGTVGFNCLFLVPFLFSHLNLS